MNEVEGIRKKMTDRQTDKLFMPHGLKYLDLNESNTRRMYINFISDLRRTDSRGSGLLIQLTKWFGNEHIHSLIYLGDYI